MFQKEGRKALISLVINIIFTNPAYYVEKVLEGGIRTAEFDIDKVPLELRWLETAGMWCNVLSYLFYIVMIVFFCVVYNALFRKYYARSPFLMTFLCAVLPVRGFVLFAVRNNTPVDYEAYMRRRMEEYARSQQPYGGYGQGGYGGYGGPSNGGNGSYGGNGGYNPPPRPPQEDPFSEFGSSGGGDGSSGQSPSSSNDDNPFSDF